MVFWGGFGTEIPDGAVDEKQMFTERINLCLVILVGCDFNELNWITRDGANGDFDDN